jgi:hypothetical protein
LKSKSGRGVGWKPALSEFFSSSTSFSLEKRTFVPWSAKRDVILKTLDLWVILLFLCGPFSFLSLAKYLLLNIIFYT